MLENGKPQAVSVFAAGDFPVERGGCARPELQHGRPAAGDGPIGCAGVPRRAARPRTRRPSWRSDREVETVAPLSTDRAAQYAGARSNRRIRHDRTLRFGCPRDRADAAGKGPTRARPAVGRHRSLQQNDGGECARAGAPFRRHGVPDRCRRVALAVLRATRGADRRRRVFTCAIRVSCSDDAPARGSRAAFSVPARLRAGCHGDDWNGGVAPYYGPCQAARRHGPGSRRVPGQVGSRAAFRLQPQLVCDHADSRPPLHSSSISRSSSVESRRRRRPRYVCWPATRSPMTSRMGALVCSARSSSPMKRGRKNRALSRAARRSSSWMSSRMPAVEPAGGIAGAEQAVRGEIAPSAGRSRCLRA